jgi:hypothetical protein
MTNCIDQQANLFILGLEENAIDSLVHAVEHFLDDEKPTYVKYSILHLFHAVELFLKARLIKIDSQLIFRENDSKKTLSFDNVKDLLQKKGVTLPEEDKETLKELKLIRNKIEHYQIEHDRNEIKDHLGRAFHFLEAFLKDELDMSLKEHLDKVDENAYKTLSMAYLFHFKRMNANGVPYPPHPKYDSYRFYHCHECKQEAIVVPDPRTSDSSAYCFCCFSRYIVNYCPMCEAKILALESIDRSATKIEKPMDFDPNEDSDHLEEPDWPGYWGFCENCMDRIMTSP